MAAAEAFKLPLARWQLGYRDHVHPTLGTGRSHITVKGSSTAGHFFDRRADTFGRKRVYSFRQESLVTGNIPIQSNAFIAHIAHRKLGGSITEPTVTEYCQGLSGDDAPYF